VGLNVPTEISDYFWWGIWWRKPDEAIIAPRPVWLEGQVQLQQMLWGWTAAITSNGQQNTKTISAAEFVQSRASERPLYTNVMWVCAWCRVSPITTQKRIFKAVLLQLACVCVCVVWWLKNGSRCHRTSAAARIMWLIKYLYYILYTACKREE
jgi:hypothetical protein